MSVRSVRAPSLVSVVVIAHNQEYTVGDVLAALADQADTPAFEVVAVDNNSIDGTLEVLRAAKMERISVVRATRGQGAAVTRNNDGAAAASGDLLLSSTGTIYPLPTGCGSWWRPL